jgi:hypothetical protein
VKTRSILHLIFGVIAILFVAAPDLRADEANQMVGVWIDEETGATYTIPDVPGAFKITITFKGGQTQTVDADWGVRGRHFNYTTEKGVKWVATYNPATPKKITLKNTQSDRVHNLKRVAKRTDKR